MPGGWLAPRGLAPRRLRHIAGRSRHLLGLLGLATPYPSLHMPAGAARVAQQLSLLRLREVADLAC